MGTAIAYQPNYVTATSLVKSVQSVSITIAIGATSNTATLSTEVNPEKAIILYNGRYSSDTSLNPAEDFAKITLTNSTTVTADTNTANAGATRVVLATVVEFYEWAVNKVVYGTVTSSANVQADQNIENVNTALSAVIYLGQTTDRTTFNLIRDSCVLSLLNANTVRVNRGSFTVADNIIVGFCVVEFAYGVLASLQTAEVSVPATTTSGTSTINSVTIGNCLTVYGGWRQTVSGVDDKRYTPRGILTNSTTLTANINTAGGSTQVSSMRMTVIEFNSKWIAGKDVGAAVIASGAATQDTAVGALVIAKTALSFLGHTTDTNSSGNDGPFAAVSITSTTNVRATRGATPATTVTPAWEALEFI